MFYVYFSSSHVVVPVYTDDFLLVSSLSMSLSPSWDIAPLPVLLQFTVSLCCKIDKE